MKLSFYVIGNVQNVMFRQTFVRAAIKRKLKAGASNDEQDLQRVHCSLSGDATIIDEMLSKLLEGKPINSWNAYVDELHQYDYFIELSEHQVTTDNVGQFNWSPNVEFYL
ncbi:MAG: acylphosphatase [Nitrosomonas sp.]|nr:acylphosphatase [Nitrosomonas sp.]